MRFIPLDKIKILREKANSGDDKAYGVLRAQLDGEDFEPLLNDYFNPSKVEENIADEVEQDSPAHGLDIKMVDSPEEAEKIHHREEEKRHNGLDIKMVDDDGNEVEEHKPCEFGNKISENVTSLINEIDKVVIELTNNDEINDSTKSGIMNSLNDLKKQSLDAIVKLKNIRKDIDKKQK